MLQRLSKPVSPRGKFPPSNPPFTVDPKLALPVKNGEKGAGGKKKANLQTGRVVYPTNWRRLSEELATKYMWEPVGQGEGFDHIFI